MTPRPLLVELARKKHTIPKWRTRERHVTLIMGLESREGALLCADSEETLSGYSKRNIDKTVQWEHTPFRFSIGAAGAGHYAEMISREVSAALFNVSMFSPKEITKAIESTLLTFHKEHIWARGRSESADEAAVQLIVICQPLPRGRIYTCHTCETAVNGTPPSGHVSIGVGAHLANYLLNSVYDSSGGMDHLIATGAYVLKEVAEHIAGVGKDDPNLTFFSTDGTVEFVGGDAITKLYRGCEQYCETIQELFAYLTDFSGERNCGASRKAEVTEAIGTTQHLFRVIAKQRAERTKELRELCNRPRLA